jgi:hypothetical protein
MSDEEWEALYTAAIEGKLCPTPKKRAVREHWLRRNEGYRGEEGAPYPSLELDVRALQKLKKRFFQLSNRKKSSRYPVDFKSEVLIGWLHNKLKNFCVMAIKKP